MLVLDECHFHSIIGHTLLKTKLWYNKLRSINIKNRRNKKFCSAYTCTMTVLTQYYHIFIIIFIAELLERIQTLEGKILMKIINILNFQIVNLNILLPKNITFKHELPIRFVLFCLFFVCFLIFFFWFFFADELRESKDNRGK